MLFSYAGSSIVSVGKVPSQNSVEEDTKIFHHEWWFVLPLTVLQNSAKGTVSVAELEFKNSFIFCA